MENVKHLKFINKTIRMPSNLKNSLKRRNKIKKKLKSLLTI